MNQLPSLRKLKNISIVEDLFFKHRTIFRIKGEAYEGRNPSHSDYSISSYHGQTTKLGKEILELLQQRITSEQIKHRLHDKNCSLFIAHEDKTGSPIGYYWGVVAESAPTWHDSFKIPTGTGLVFNAYVSKDHRKNGVYRLLQATAHNYLLSSPSCDSVFTIVENRNTSSMAANQKFGLNKYAKNYLVKIFSINIFSVVNDGLDRNIYFVVRKGGL